MFGSWYINYITWVIGWKWMIYSLVGGWATPLKNMKALWKSVGMMKFPIYGKLKHVPNHQPDCIMLDCDLQSRMTQLGFWSRKRLPGIDGFKPAQLASDPFLVWPFWSQASLNPRVPVLALLCWTSKPWNFETIRCPKFLILGFRSDMLYNFWGNMIKK
jgi:hypothetical protein